MLALQLIRRSRSCDGVVIAFGPGVPLAATAGRVERAVTLGLLGVALRSFSDVTLRLASPIPLPGGVGGRATAAMWSRATSIVVENEADRERVVLAPGVDAACLVVRPTAAPAHGGRSMAWNELHFDTADLRSQVQLAVRERAAEARRVNSARVELGAKGVLDDGAGPFSGTSARVSPPDPVVLARVFAGRVRRVLRKLATQP